MEYSLNELEIILIILSKQRLAFALIFLFIGILFGSFLTFIAIYGIYTVILIFFNFLHGCGIAIFFGITSIPFVGLFRLEVF
jgi:hypothetical protein